MIQFVITSCFAPAVASPVDRVISHKHACQHAHQPWNMYCISQLLCTWVAVGSAILCTSLACVTPFPVVIVATCAYYELLPKRGDGQHMCDPEMCWLCIQRSSQHLEYWICMFAVLFMNPFFYPFFFLFHKAKTVLGLDTDEDVSVDIADVVDDNGISTNKDDVKLKLPAQGWASLSDINSPDAFKLKFTMATAIDYFYAQRAGDGLATSDYRNLGNVSLALYSCGYAREGALIEHEGLLLFSCKFRATMKTGVRYDVHLAFQKVNGFYQQLIYSSACQCPGGAPLATCKHVGGVCHGLDDYCKTGKFVEGTSSTSSLCKWNAPPPQRRVSEMKFDRGATCDPQDDGRDVSGPKRIEYDPRPPSKRSPDPAAEAAKLKCLLEKASETAPGKPVLLEVLADKNHETSVTSSVTLHPILTTLSRVVSLLEVVPDSCLDSLLLSSRQVQALEYRTRQQSNCRMWHDHRYGHLTCSNFGLVLNRRNGAFESLADQLLSPPKSLSHVPAISGA